MYWINFLHIYQPFNQSDEILKRVVNECYRPLFSGLLKIKNFKINLNINASLTQLLAKKGYRDVINYIRELARTNRLEFTESAKYHTLLPFLNQEEIERQIKSNYFTNKKYFGRFYKPKCFFPPEMAYHPKIAKVVSKYCQLILLDEIAFPFKSESFQDKLFKIKGENLICIFRERRTSNALMSALIKTKRDFYQFLGEDLKKNIYLCTGIDGETFGHHRPGLEKALFKIVSLKKPKQIFLSEIQNYFKIEGEISPLPSCWASSLEDIEKGAPFYSWKNPKNKVQNLQWKFLNYLKKIIKQKKTSKEILEKLDRASCSDQFFWASGEPWWSIEMIEKGAFELLKLLKTITKNKKEIKEGERLYHRILETAFFWQRSGKIEEKGRKYREAVKIPFKERTLEIGGKEVYQKILSLFRERMLKAAKEKNYEKAILWRDAIWKIETKNDIYDFIHVVDLLRMEIPEKFKELDPVLNRLWQEYKEKYKKIQSGQPELRRA